jgi:hypothetical protein
MKKLIFVTACTIIIITAFLVSLIFLHVTRLPFVQLTFLGATHSLTHWIIKRKSPLHFKNALNIHILGNLLAVLLVSVHFAHQVTRPASAYPTLGTGVVLYATMVLLVATGLVLISGVGKRYFKQIRFLHPAFALTFYLVIVMHIIHGI